MLSLSAPQNIFLNGLNTKYRAYVGGFGSGKTFVGCLDLLIFAGQNPKTVQGYFGTTYPSIRDIFYPTLTEAAEMMGYRVEIIESHKEVHIYRGRVYYGTIICRSVDNPASIVGFKISRALVDEIDTLPKDKATNAWNKIVARLRLVIPGVENGIGVTTTPEGFLFVYSKFKENPTKSYSMVQASTYENADYLPPDYIDTLIETYPSGLIDAYLKGKFVNLTSGSVYPNYCRQRCNSNEVILQGEPLIIGMDFNVNKMAACVFVQRKNGLHQVAEISNGQDTPYMIKIIKERWQSLGHKISIYPDASGKNTSSKGASLSDISLLEQAGFYVIARDSNPRVKDRVNAVNKAFETGKLWINAAACPESARCIEQQPYDKNGEPDKKGGLDHQSDAFGYPVCYLMPVQRPMAAAPRFGR
jgi:hypothetical protein